MILEELNLTNYGVYKGEHKIDLRPDEGKPVILFGAYNGSGKTTFLDALNLVLYGKLSKSYSKGKAGYEDYLESMINRNTPKQHGAGITLKFRIHQNSKDEVIRITRTWYKSGSTIKENFEVLRDDSVDSLYTERWQDFIEEILPSSISELFFFDGEKIEGLADPAKSAEILKTGIYSLLGINEVDNLIKNLGQIEKKKLSEIAKETNQISMEQEEFELNKLSQKKQAVLTELAGLSNEFDVSEREIASTEKQLEISGADLLRDRKALEERLLHLNYQVEHNDSELINIAGSDLPMTLVRDQLSEISSSLENGQSITQKTLNIIQSEYSQFLAMANEVPANVSQFIEDIVNKRKLELTKKCDEFIVDLDTESIPSNDYFETLINRIKELNTSSEALEEEILLIQRKLSAVPNEDTVAKILAKLSAQTQTKTKIQTKKELLEISLLDIEKDLEDISKILSNKMINIAIAKTENFVTERVIKHARKSKETLISYKHSLVQKYIDQLGSQITLSFNELHRKDNMDLKFQVNSENFTLKILKGEYEVRASSLSAGERQLLSVAILWALAKSSNRDLPAVIDTPLGRLDGPHRNKLICNYFPQASRQVLIFSTDEEINDIYYKKLKPFVAKEYLINYNNETESSVVTSGYFGS